MKAACRRLLAHLLERQVRRLIARHHLRIVAVAGSVGKTTTRQAVATVLSEKFRTPDIVRLGYNSEIGLPLSVFGLPTPTILVNPFAWADRLIRTEILIRGRYPYDILVLELGTDHPGEIARYLRYLKPDFGIITAITPEHMQNFPGGLDQVAAEELQLAAASKQVIASHDIPAKYRHHYIDPHPHHHYYEQNGEPLAKAKQAAQTAGELLGLTPAQLEAGLANIRPVPGRQNPLAGQNGSIIIDDTYNSSPAAVSTALEALANLPNAKRRLAILGSMNELGSDSPAYHDTAGAQAADLDYLVTLGADANKYLGPAAVRAGLDPTRLQAAESPTAAGLYISLILQPGDVVLVKGSQNGVFAEEAIKQLLADPADSAHLVRQSKTWLRTKHKQFPDVS